MKQAAAELQWYKDWKFGSHLPTWISR